MQGKNLLIRSLTPNSKEVNMTAFQKRMRRVNNCKATSFKCAYCLPTRRWKCMQNTIRSYQLEALKKYGDTPQMRKAIDERIKQEKNEKMQKTLGSEK